MVIIALIIVCIILAVFLSNVSNNKDTDDTMTFETAFKNRVGQDPTSYVASKLSSGSDLGAIRYLFDIIAAEVEVKSKRKSPGFDFYYKKVLSEQPPKDVEATSTQLRPTKAFVVSELIGKERFLKEYDEQLKRLAADQEFMRFVMELRRELAGRETTDKKAANKRIADYFYENKANERFSEVSSIVARVVFYGKQASAHISIYYAMYLYK